MKDNHSDKLGVETRPFDGSDAMGLCMIMI